MDDVFYDPSRSDIFFVDVNLTRHQSIRLLRLGQIERVEHTNIHGEDPRAIRATFLRSGLSAERKASVLKRHAARLAMQLHSGNSDIMLASQSALHGQAVSNILYLAVVGGARSTRVVGGAFALHYSQLNVLGPTFQPLKETLGDDLGRVEVNRLPDEALFLLSFQLSRPVSSDRFKMPKIELSSMEQRHLFDRLCMRYGEFKLAWPHVRECASSLRVADTVLERARLFASSCMRTSMPVMPQARFDVRFDEGWRMGQLKNFAPKLGSNNWQFEPETDVPAFSFLRTPPPAGVGRLPVFFECLLPERRAAVDDADRSRMYQLFGMHERYMGRITIENSHQRPSPRILDAHETSIARHVDERGIFSGTIDLPSAGPGELMYVLSRESERFEHPAIAGMQDKMGCHLSADGVLQSATDRSFTHILKFGFAKLMEPVPSGEWFCAHLMKAAGVKTADFALVDLGEEAYPAFLSERFDLPRQADCTLVFEDFCSLLNRPIHLKYKGAIEEVVASIKDISTHRERDFDQFFRQIAASFLLGNMDAHLRNFGILTTMRSSSIASSGCRQMAFDAHLAPAFDVVCTNGLPWISSTPALSINKSRHYDIESFCHFGGLLGMNREKVEATLSKMSSAMIDRADVLLETLPACLSSRERVVDHLQFIRLNVLETSRHLGVFKKQATSIGRRP